MEVTYTLKHDFPQKNPAYRIVENDMVGAITAHGNFDNNEDAKTYVKDRYCGIVRKYWDTSFTVNAVMAWEEDGTFVSEITVTDGEQLEEGYHYEIFKMSEEENK